MRVDELIDGFPSTRMPRKKFRAEFAEPSDEELLARRRRRGRDEDGEAAAAVNNANLKNSGANPEHFGVVKAPVRQDAQGAGKERQPEQGLS